MMRRSVRTILLAVGLLTGGLTPAGAQVQPCPCESTAISTPCDVYTVKFLCGAYAGIEFVSPATISPQISAEGPVKPGNYQTAINVHNPQRVPVALCKKAVLLFDAARVNPPETPHPPGPLKTLRLPPDWGVEIDCYDIRTTLLGRQNTNEFIKGVVVLEVPPPSESLASWLIDVLPAYTAQGCTQEEDKPNKECRFEGISLQVERVPALRIQ